MRYYRLTKPDCWQEKEISEEEWNAEIAMDKHYVAYAIPGLTFSAEYFRKFGIPYKELFETVNSADEVGTLFPMANGTMLPFYQANYYMTTVKHHECPDSQKIKDYMQDVAKANNEYIRSDTIMLDLRDLSTAPNLIDNMILLNTIEQAKVVFGSNSSISSLLIATS